MIKPVRVDDDAEQELRAAIADRPYFVAYRERTEESQVIAFAHASRKQGIGAPVDSGLPPSAATRARWRTAQRPRSRHVDHRSKPPAVACGRLLARFACLALE